MVPRAFILIAFFGVGFSHGLQCYQCVDGTPDGCDRPTLVTCEPQNAEFQISNLNFLFNFKKPSDCRKRYQCFSYEADVDFGDGKDSTKIRGCLYESYKVCDWRLKAGLNEKPNTRKCQFCSENGCNS